MTMNSKSWRVCSISHRTGLARARSAFTIIELLVSIAIIFLLIASAAVALKAARRGANRAETMMSLKQMVAGYIAYAKEHNDRLMPGNPDPAFINVPPMPTSPTMVDMRVKNPRNDAQNLNPADTAPYVWRLAPYLDGNWKVMTSDYRSLALNSRFENELSAGVFGPGSAAATQIGLAGHPAIGLNSLYVGGDGIHGGPAVTPRSPWANLPTFPNPNRIAALRTSEVKNPSKQIVFAPCEDADPGLMVAFNMEFQPGSCELRAPYGLFDRASGLASEPEWRVNPADNKVMKIGDFTAGGGWPVDRLGENKIAFAHLDGNVDLLPLEFFNVDLTLSAQGQDAAKAQIMSYWSPFAIGDR